MQTTFRPARAGSVHVAPWQRQHLGEADRRRIMDAARRLDRQTRQPGQHGGCLKRTGIAVLWVLLYRGWGRSGICDPALSQLAAWAGCSRSTVQEAIRRIEEAGILRHIKRGLIVKHRGRARWCQWTSAYLFRPLARWCAAAWVPAGSDTGNWEASVSEDSSQRELLPLPPSQTAELARKWGLIPSKGDT